MMFGGRENQNGDASDGSERSQPGSRDSRDLSSLMASCYPITLKVQTKKEIIEAVLS